MLAEFLGSAIYACMVLGVSLNSDLTNTADHLRIAITFGLTLGSLSFMFASSSGGIINPAVTIACAIARRINILQAIGYLIVQCGGAITGMASIYALTPSSRRGNLGVLELRNSTKYWQGFVIEGILGFVVTFVYLSGSDPNQESSSGPSLPYGSITVGAHLFAIPYTGCGINPARALAPAVLKSHWPSYHWIYWAGPILGATLAGLFYWLVFSVVDYSSSGSADLDHRNDFIIERPPGLTNGGLFTTTM